MALFTKDFWKGMDDGAAEARRVQKAEEEALANESARRKEAQEFLFAQARENRAADLYSQNWAGNQVIDEKNRNWLTNWNAPGAADIRAMLAGNDQRALGTEALTNQGLTEWAATPTQVQRGIVGRINRFTNQLVASENANDTSVITNARTAAFNAVNLRNPLQFDTVMNSMYATMLERDPTISSVIEQKTGIPRGTLDVLEYATLLRNPHKLAEIGMERKAIDFKTRQALELQSAKDDAAGVRAAQKNAFKAPTPKAGAPSQAAIPSPTPASNTPARTPGKGAEVLGEMTNAATPSVMPVAPSKKEDPAVTINYISSQIELQKLLLTGAKTQQEYQVVKYKLDLLKSQLAVLLQPAPPPPPTRAEEAARRERFISGKE